MTANLKGLNPSLTAYELSHHVRVVCHAHDIGQTQPSAQGGQ
jgi:hypothetical protein